MYSRILVPLDGSKRAETILPHVEELARLYGAEVLFLQVIEFPPVVSWIVGTPFDEEQRRQRFQRWKEDAEFYLAAWKDKFQEKGIEA